ncbi:MAG: AAA-like domain-containing protein [Roseofilum sp. SBFL]|uniref:AAA-like domain-containing protein n=1 Tax=unclassified Roseofilum TaxID=2620099 RepID=UPI001AFFE338|nr:MULTISPECIES: AAA-like domain-containing protein [unclassified Roseofilum]MBP0012913.1 AAA-like domain-containing protein [Roseofilum sp. SID3]MBP0026572.1 AAA-like domain-containing protein [Roseofilum sp. SID2]MBP0037377.1 AAA-like domain-containing protein [Roseofilum sp. SID1]MBP0040750.1 AAA-like domain-containing protein [Roseofilum sp. SBFL]
MNQIQFIQSFANLTPRRQEVLLKVLAGEEDTAIAEQLYIQPVTVRKHIQHICDAFLGDVDPQEAGYSRRGELVALIAKYRPELIGEALKTNRELQPQKHHILLSYYQSPTDPPLSLISQLYETLRNSGYTVTLADNCLRMAKNGLQQIYRELNTCEEVLLLLSPLSAVSEMITEEVRIVKSLQESRQQGLPHIIPLEIKNSFSLLNHDLRGYLQDLPRLRWRSPDDTPKLIKTLLQLLAEGDRQQMNELSPPEQPTNQSYAILPKSPPQPIAEPEIPRGQVELASAFYIERPRIETRCYEAIEKPGALIRIKAPRQMGKTSLMARILHHACTVDYATVPLSFQLADSKVFTDLELFLKWFCANISLQINLPVNFEEHWNSIFGAKVACKSYFENYILPYCESPLVLGLDEVDVVFSFPDIASDFFSLLRAWHEEGKNREIWKQLRLVVVHSTEVYVPMSINQSPFNVGLPIELPEFPPEKILELAHRHGLDWTISEVNQLMSMVGGHPYLVRLALYHIARHEITLKTVLETAATDAGLYSDHLRRHLWNLHHHSVLKEALKKVVISPQEMQLESIQAFKLHSMGLIHLQGHNVIPRCNLYRQYFRVQLS